MRGKKNRLLEIFTFHLLCWEMGRFVGFDLHLFNYWEMCAWAGGIMKFHSCCKRWQQGTQQPGLSFSQIKAEPEPRWKKYCDEMCPKIQVAGSWLKVTGPTFSIGSPFLPSQPKGRTGHSPRPRVACQVPAHPLLHVRPTSRRVQDSHTPTALALPTVLKVLLAPDSTCLDLPATTSGCPFSEPHLHSQVGGHYPKDRPGVGKWDKNWPSPRTRCLRHGSWDLASGHARADGNHGNEGGQHLGEGTVSRDW